MTLTLLIADCSLNEAQAGRIAQSTAGWADCTRLPGGAPHAQFQAAVAVADIVVGWPAPAWLRDGHPRLVLLPSAGYEEFEGQGLGSQPGLTICNTSGVYSVGCAEHAAALMLALTRNLGAHVREAAHRRWNRTRPYGEIAGAGACIVGLGDVGQAVARRCAGLGMSVTGVRRAGGAPPPGVTRVYPPEALLAAVAEAQHVFCTLPGGRETFRLIGREVFAAMPAGSYFYNLGRGSSVDETALIEALRGGHLRGAGIDVLDLEPPQPDNPLWEMENVILTPHVAGLAARHAERLCALVIENLARRREGRPLLNVLALD